MSTGTRQGSRVGMAVDKQFIKVSWATGHIQYNTISFFMGEIYLHVCLMLCCMPGYTNDPSERYSAVSYMVFNSIQAPVCRWSFIIDWNIFSPNKTNFSTVC